MSTVLKQQSMDEPIYKVKLMEKGRVKTIFVFYGDKSPKNKQEADLLKKIVKTIKRRMLPGTAGSNEASTGPLFSFPDVVDISFGPDSIEPYLIQRSVLTSMTVNYAPNGTPSFFRDSSPTDIEIGLNFKEIRVVTRNDYTDKPTSGKEVQTPVVEGIANDRGDM